MLKKDEIAPKAVPSIQVEKPAEIAPAIQQALAYRPFLIDVVVQAEVQPGQIGIKCGQ
jgi:thiamine pyrophosphate-dependent acetolactate synthase large subunit-like protein